MGRSFSLPIVMAAALAAACSLDPALTSPAASGSAPVSMPAETPTTTPTASGSVPERVPLPSGFPVLPGAVPLAMADDDPGLIGLWTSDQLGSAAYDFYVAALPAAGYPILGLYPGGQFAVIGFRLPDGAIWQMVAHGGGNDTVAIEIRLDRP